MKLSQLVKLLLLCVLVTITVTAFAGVPQSINYQGYLTATGGAPATGPLGMTFSLYSSNPARNNPVWQETQPAVAVTNGIYSVQLGSVMPIIAPFDVPYWLGIQVGTDPEMSLQPLSSVPYALRASLADTALQATLADNATRVSGQTISQLDSRYVNATQPNPTAQQVAMLRWDLVRGGSGTYAVGSSPMGLAFDGSSVWVANFGSGSVMKINPATGAVIATITVGSYPIGLAFDGSNMWVGNMGDGTVMKINPATGVVGTPIPVGSSPYALAFDGSNIWVANMGDGTVMKINPTTEEVSAAIPVGLSPAALAFDGSNVWVANYGDSQVPGTSSVMKINPVTLEVGAPISVGVSPIALAFDGTSIWVANYDSNNIMKINPTTEVVSAPVPVGNNPSALVFDGRSVWVANLSSRNLMKVDPASGTAGSPITIGGQPSSLTFDGSNIWAATYDPDTVTKLAAAGLPVGAQTVTADSIVDGAVTDSKLSANVALLDSPQTFSAAKSFSTAPGFTASTGAPFTVTSEYQNLVTNLNADLLDGQHASYYLDFNNFTGTISDALLSSNVALLNTPQTFAAVKTFSSAPDFSASTGAPFTVTSPTLVPNLNADLLDGLNSSYYLDSANLVGTLADARLSSNVALLDTPQTFAAVKTFASGSLSLRNAANTFSTTLSAPNATLNRAFIFPDTGAGTVITTSNLTNITQVGTVTSGIWNGTVISPLRGGTGLNTSTAGAGSLLRTTNTGVWGVLGPGGEGSVLKISAGQPVWGTDSSNPGTVTGITAGSGLTGGTITGSGTIAIDTTVVPQLSAANTFTAGTQTIQTGLDTTRGLLVQGAVNQSANLQEWLNSDSTVLASVSANGVFSGDGSGLTNVVASTIADGAVTDIKITGPLSDSKLSTNVALLNAPQTFTDAKTFSMAPSFSASTGAPFTVSSPTLVSNLNADLLDGQDSAYYLDAANHVGNLSDARLSSNVALLNAPQTFSAAKTFSTAPSFSASTGAPFTVSSSALVSNLNADLLDGLHAATFLNASNLSAGTLPSNRLAGSYTGITEVGTLTSLAVSGSASIGGTLSFVTPRTAYYNVSAAAFNPLNSNTTYDGTWLSRYLTSPSGTQELAASVSLPHGAAVQNISCQITDASSAFDVTFGLVNSITNNWVCGPVTTTGSQPGLQKASVTCITPETIDNINSSYVLRFLNNSSCGSGCSISACTVTYTVTSLP